MLELTGDSTKKKTINLFCPALSKVSQLAACEDQRLDLGFIARAFGLEPSSLMLNGHFISRGLDLIASSVTWKSLISYFSTKGLSTGTCDSDALVVHGRLCKSGTKRAYDDTADDETGASCSNRQRSDYEIVQRKSKLEEMNLLTRKRFRDSGCDDAADRVTKQKTLTLKRKQCLESDSSHKRTRMDKTVTEEKENAICAAISNIHFPCSSLWKNMKRARDETTTNISCKKSR